MCNCKKRKRLNEVEEDHVTAESSYQKLLSRCAMMAAELEQVRLRLQLTEQIKNDVDAHLEQALKALQDTHRIKEELASELELVRCKLAQETNINDDVVKSMIAENTRLKSRMVMCRLHIERLTKSVVDGSDAYDSMAAKVSVLEETIKSAFDVKAKHRSKIHVAERAVARHFGLCKATADPLLYGAAIGFWRGCTPLVCEGEERIGVNTRSDIWLKLTSICFKGKVMADLERLLLERRRFDVVELARKSDVNCKFNATAVGAVSSCEVGKKKYDRGILCSDATLRRTQKRVLNLAKSLGFSSFPSEEEGKVWCWGDEHGEFVTAVNRYVYEVYVKARCPLVTKDKPWLIPLSGDLVRVTSRGKSMTICGPKLADPRLPCQQATGKTSNQSRNLYTPAVAGYVDEAHLMNYFDRMVACFREIEARGFCEVDKVRHEVFIDVLVVADMAYLHKYLQRGGGSHSCTHFCFLCSVSSKYRAEGYPGGCLKCRAADVVYDCTTGAQQCRHHDVCDRDFLAWETARLAYLKENVAPRIPKSCKPYYTNLESLRDQCLSRCREAKDFKHVTKTKTYAALERWLLAEGRTREGCDLSCNIHTGIKICPLSLVREDLRLRGVVSVGLTEIDERKALESLLREEEEYLKLDMYVRDHRFTDLLHDSGHRSELHKTIIDMLHCPMRTNEKVLNLLYEEVTQGAHKAETKSTLDCLTEAIRRVGELPPSFRHKFEKKNTKVLEKIKLPYDQSRKIFAIEQLPRLRELVHIAVPPSEDKRREEWMNFLYHYVHVNEKLHSTLEYTAEDIADLQTHIDATYCLLVTSIGGAEHGVTNYFHYLGSGHVMWMIKRYGNLWRFCNEGVESLNSLASKRYNGFNNKGGHKAACKDEAKQNCLPFEVLGSWLSRLSMWHIGAADTMFSVESTKLIVWNTETKSYSMKKEFVSDDDDDSNWRLSQLEEGSSSFDEDSDGSSREDEQYDSEDMLWCTSVARMDTWDQCVDTGSKYSKRVKYQLLPFLL